MSVYQDKIKYKENNDFSGNKSSFINSVPQSIPNTFNYKSHPNAKTKELGSTIDEDHNNTPDWMPVELNEQWVSEHNPPQPDFTSSVRITKKDSNTMIHNSDLNETPDWKKTTTSARGNNLKKIFDPPSMEYPKSPLKLFTDNYDTYTEQKLNGVLNNLRNTPAHVLKKVSAPKMNSIPRPSKSFADFAKKGDAIMNNIRKNYNGIRVVSQNTATSTPKNDKIVSIEDEYESYTSGFSSDEESVKLPKESESKSYTFDTISELRKENEEIKQSLEQPMIDTSPLTFEANEDNHNDTVYHEDVFKWKSKSQLSNKGLIQPGDMPVDYENMYYDPVNQRWLEKNKQNNSLEGIEDLTEEITPILRKPSRKNLEVSFHEPGNVTRISQVEEETFSESKKQLISILSELIQQSSWDQIDFIDLENCELDTIKDLNMMLPNLKKVNLSNNNLVYLKGLPETTMSLDVSNNNIQDLTPLTYPNLHNLNLSSNSLTNGSNLSENIHLTTLNLNNNKIENAQLHTLINLNLLDLSSNKLDQFDIFLPQLQVLNLNENKLISIDMNNFPKLRVLNLDENRLTHFESNHAKLAKLSINLNKLVSLEVSQMKELRCLKFDGNPISQIEIRNCLEQLSCKGQSSNVVARVNHLTNLQKLDVSGTRLSISNPMLYISDLTLSAMGLTSLPSQFEHVFPNVQNLNLNFNKLENIDNLSHLNNLKKLYLLSNNFQKFKDLQPLKNVKKGLRVLDIRMNPITNGLWSFVFSQEEHEGTVQLDYVEAMNGFIEHYEELDKSDEWQERDETYLQANTHLIPQRLKLETLLLVLFTKLRKLNGNRITRLDHENARKNYTENGIRY